MKAGLGIGAAAVLLGLAACTSPDTRAEANASPAGISGSCINPTEISRQQIVSDQEIRFEMRNGDVWTNTMKRACPGLKMQGGFNWEVRGTMVCSNQQRIEVLQVGTPCQLGVFTKAPKGAEPPKVN